MTRSMFALLALTLPMAVAAHDGHAETGVLVEIASAVTDGKTLSVTAILTNLEDAPRALSGVSAEGALMTALPQPLAIAAGQSARMSADFDFAGPVPGILSLGFDFGADGAGPVLVIPEIGGSDVL